MKQLDVVEATFSPKRTFDLAPHVAEAIGKRGHFMAVWIVEEDEGRYAGQWAMAPCNKDGSHCGGFTDMFDFGWAPLCDLSEVRLER